MQVHHTYIAKIR